MNSAWFFLMKSPSMFFVSTDPPGTASSRDGSGKQEVRHIRARNDQKEHGDDRRSTRHERPIVLHARSTSNRQRTEDDGTRRIEVSLAQQPAICVGGARLDGYRLRNIVKSCDKGDVPVAPVPPRLLIGGRRFTRETAERHPRRRPAEANALESAGGNTDDDVLLAA
jgi:hypothetical protein